MARSVVALVVALWMSIVFIQPLHADDATAAPDAGHTHLLGDWGGLRTTLAAHGIIVDIRATQFYQGVVDGSPGTSDWQYGVKGDYFLTVLGEQAGLWKGLIVNLHGETRGGEDVNGLTGLSPANANMLMPNANSVTALTQAMAIQMLGPQTAVAGGKFNAIDFVDMVFHTGRGIDGFMNTSLVLPIGLGVTVPVALSAAGLLKFKGKEVQGVAVVYDPNNCATTSCFDPLFEDTAVLGLWKFFTGSRGEGAREGYIAVGGTYSFKKYTVADPASLYFNPAVGLVLTDEDESWTIVSVIDQPLWTDPSDPSRDVSFKGMYTISDGKANPIKWTATAALEVNGPIASRPLDKFGVGYFHNELASGFKDLVGPLLSLAATIAARTPTRINVHDTDGFEVYYKAQVTPWFAVTGDVQVITETLSTNDTRVVTGVRGLIVF